MAISVKKLLELLGEFQFSDMATINLAGNEIIIIREGRELPHRIKVFDGVN